MNKKNWIQDAIKHKGALRKKAAKEGLIKGDEKLSMTDLKKLEKEGGKTAKQASLAKTLRKFEIGGVIPSRIVMALGGLSKLRTKYGAYDFVEFDNGLSFRIRNAKTNFIKITQNNIALIDLEIGIMRGTNFKLVYKGKDLQLVDLKWIIDRNIDNYMGFYKDGGIADVKKYKVKYLIGYSDDQDELNYHERYFYSESKDNLALKVFEHFRTLGYTHIEILGISLANAKNNMDIKFASGGSVSSKRDSVVNYYINNIDDDVLMHDFDINEDYLVDRNESYHRLFDIISDSLDDDDIRYLYGEFNLGGDDEAYEMASGGFTSSFAGTPQKRTTLTMEDGGFVEKSDEELKGMNDDELFAYLDAKAAFMKQFVRPLSSYKAKNYAANTAAIQYQNEGTSKLEENFPDIQKIKEQSTKDYEETIAKRKMANGGEVPNNIKENPTYKKLLEKSKIHIGKEQVRMPSIQKIKELFEYIGIDVYAYKNRLKAGKFETFKFRDKPIFDGYAYEIDIDSTDTYYSFNTPVYAKNIIKFIDDFYKNKMANGGDVENIVKNKLSKSFELPLQMAIYVPSTKDKKVSITERELKIRVKEVQDYLAKLFGGFNSTDVDGGFESSDKGVIVEDAVRVVAFANKDNFEEKFEKLFSQIKIWCKEWSQESIGLEFENDLYYIETDSQYMKKGGITFNDKVKAIKYSLLKNKIVPKKLQKDYGKTYSPKEAEASAKRIAGAMLKRMRY
jgi:hypothetical protein